MRRVVGEEVKSAVSQAQFNRGSYSGGRGFRGGRGGNFGYSGRGGYGGYPQGGSIGQAGNNAASVAINAAYGSYDQGPKCFACFGRDKNGGIETEYPHTHSDRCYQLNELCSKGVCHKNVNGRLCFGPWDPNAEEIYFRRDSPWIPQILMRTQGTQWDVKLENRPRNIHRLAEQRKEAVNSQASEYLMTPANVQGNMTVIKRPNSVGVPI